MLLPRQIGCYRIKNSYEVVFVAQYCMDGARFDLPTEGLPILVLFWKVMPCRLVNGYRLFREGCSLHIEGLAVQDQDPEDGGITLIRNVGNFLSVDTSFMCPI